MFSKGNRIMKKNLRNLACITLYLLLHSPALFACSSFLMTDGTTQVVGKNYDWNFEEGCVLVNKKGLTKTAFSVDNPVSWTSNYGSVTFNQYGREVPLGGMNEAGLVIEALWLEGSAYPEVDSSKHHIDNMQWIQYHLDNSGSVAEVIKRDSSLQITPSSGAQVHCLVADRKGNCIIVESINGETRHYQTGNNRPAVITNDRYDYSIKTMKRYKPFGGGMVLQNDKSSLTRFLTIATALKGRKESSDPVKGAFTILASVNVPSYTRWSIVYNLTKKEIHFASKSCPKVKVVTLSGLDFDCSSPAAFLDIVTDSTGKMNSAFRTFGSVQNEKLVRTSFAATPFLSGMGENALREVFSYPESITCSKKE
jgi:penicillin V acylase-like amidase (Ntn superfamily)